MTVTRKNIENLYGGVSEQPPEVRSPNQCEVQENFLSDPIKGLSKRSGIEFIASFNDANNVKFPQFIASGTDERTHQWGTFGLAGRTFPVKDSDGTDYIFTITPFADGTDVTGTGSITAVDTPWQFAMHKVAFDGNGQEILTQQTLQNESGTTITSASGLGSDASGYFTAPAFEDDTRGEFWNPYKVLSVEDNTFLLNTYQTTQMSAVSSTNYLDTYTNGTDASSQSYNLPAVCLTVLEGAYNAQYEVMLSATADFEDGTTSSLTRHVVVKTSDGLALDGGGGGNPDDSRVDLIANAIVWGLHRCPEWNYGTLAFNNIYTGQWRTYGQDTSVSSRPTSYFYQPSFQDTAIEVLAKGSGTYRSDTANDNAKLNEIFQGLYAQNSITVDPSRGIQQVCKNGTICLIPRADVSSLSVYVEAKDSFGTSLFTSFSDTKQEFAGLPKTCYEGYKVKIEGSPESDYDDYYVKFTRNNPDETDTYMGEGRWEESISNDIQYKIDENTMPFQLVKNASPANTWTIKTLDYTDKLVGDNTTNKNPGFIDKRINDVFFFRSRFGILAGETVTMSEVDEPFNLFRTTVAQSLASDRISLETSLNELTPLRHAVDFANQLVIFSERAQYLVDYGQDGLTPQTASLAKISDYQNTKRVSPVATERSIFFAEERTDSVNIWEFFPDGRTNTSFRAVRITDNVPSYIAGKIYDMDVDSKTQTLALLARDTSFTSTFPDTLPDADTVQTGQDEIFIYKWYDSGNQRVQSSWNKYTAHRYNSAVRDRVNSIWFLDDYLYMVLDVDRPTAEAATTRPSDIIDLCKLYIPNDKVQHYCLDYAFTNANPLTNFVYGNPNTSVLVPFGGNRLPFSLSAATWYLIDADNGYSALAGDAEDAGGDTITFAGDWDDSTRNLIVGVVFDAKYQFSDQYLITGGQGEKPVSVTEGRTTVKTLNVYFADPPSSNNQYVKLRAAYNGSRSDNTKEWDCGGTTPFGRKIGEDKMLPIMVGSRSEQCDLFIENDSYQPVTITKADVILNVVDKYRYTR